MTSEDQQTEGSNIPERRGQASPRERGEEQGRIQVVSQTVQFSGPLPPPEILERYNKITPGLADRIVTMAEQQSHHRQELESTVVKADVRSTRVGQFLGFGIGIAGLAAATLLGIFGQPWAAGFVGLGPIAGLVSVFVYGSKRRRNERAENRRVEVS